MLSASSCRRSSTSHHVDHDQRRPAVHIDNIDRDWTKLIVAISQMSGNRAQSLTKSRHQKSIRGNKNTLIQEGKPTKQIHP